MQVIWDSVLYQMHPQHHALFLTFNEDICLVPVPITSSQVNEANNIYILTSQPNVYVHLTSHIVINLYYCKLSDVYVKLPASSNQLVTVEVWRWMDKQARLTMLDMSPTLLRTDASVNSTQIIDMDHGCLVVANCPEHHIIVD